jgi:hypothetical protein
MNRHERQKLKKDKSTKMIDRVVAIHEAGHAVARYITAQDLGCTTDKSISYIDLAPYVPAGGSIDGTRKFFTQATTYGPMLSEELQQTVKRELANIPSGGVATLQDVAEAIAKARSEGADVSKWLRSKLLITVFGSAAEAMFSGKTPDETWNSYENECDCKDAVRECFLAGITESGEIEGLVEEAKTRAIHLIANAQVSHAVRSLADKLPATGRFDGKKAAAIIRAAMEAQRVSQPLT